MNKNPIQSVPIELTDCRYLKVLDLSNTYIRLLPLEVCQLKQLYDINLDGCPLVPKVQEVYKGGIMNLLKYYGEKLQRENLREKLVNAAKEEIWIDSPFAQIQEAIGKVLDGLEDDDIFVVQRLLRNMKYVLPAQIDHVDPYVIKLTLTTSKVGSANFDNTRSQLNNSITKPMNFKGKDYVNYQSGKNTVQFEASKISSPHMDFQSDIIAPTTEAKIQVETKNEPIATVEKINAVTEREDKSKPKKLVPEKAKATKK